jgi:anti-anti-sigma factor
MNLPHQPAKRGTIEAVAATSGHTLIVRIRGELDIATVDTLRTTLSGFAVNGHRAAVVDLGELTFCDLAGVRELVRLHHMLRDQLGTVAFQNATPQVRRIIHLAQADQEFTTLDASSPTE